MEVHKYSFVELDEFNFSSNETKEHKNCIPYFKDPVLRLRSKYETFIR